jgi:hypothetical protein
MTKYFCDVCKRDKTERELIKVRVLDGEHPHNGSAMHKTIDICIPCIQSQEDMQLESSLELSELVRS